MAMAGLFVGGVVFMLFIVALSIASIVFWIIMLVDCVQRNFKKSDERIIWILVIVLAGAIGALVYYFVVKRKAKK